ncbi:hypothetical protein A3J43_00735 [Candidatus Uhrbacteria bacterium RIFCSPHIGHO2_12_FULL_54_23]|uniref:acylphosphatase n=2 Tax=Candidatus Uhriibacteriota TaxID=1752732 RepID=A0A1F7UI24_9BACT|nr:MAG: hypothetical protein A3J43_00735 [Candidatus Uhrbacteria bacterium RIFCSPHIGHO2_12_FULL_54_23]OGL83680.1 MAG: hypothetical protein A3B36_03265 [Candidatus Uhrbacteria bacterium RIFCSPLOWO2_01_FULL_55_36]
MHLLRLVISGRVQGVGFRWFVQREAEKLKLTGQVKNLPDGTVEVAAFGEKGALEELLNLCRQGPRASRVNDIHVKWDDAEMIPTEFSIR